MKKLLLAAFTIFTAVSGTNLFANDFNVWIAPEYKLSNSSFKHDSKNKNDLLRVANSVDEEMISYIGVEAGFGWRCVSLQGTFDWGIPKDCGSISVNKYGEQSGKSEDSRYYTSSFDAQNFNIDSKLLFDIPVVRNWVSVRPYAGFSYGFKKINGKFSSGNQDFSGNSSATTMPYDTKTAITSAPDVWFKREMYDLRVGTGVRGSFFERAFVDLDFALSPFTRLTTKEYDGSLYYLDMMDGFFRNWNFGAGAGVYLGRQKNFEVGLRFNMNILNKMKSDTYYSTSENSGYQKFPDGSVTHRESVEVLEPELDVNGVPKKNEDGTVKTTTRWDVHEYTQNFSGVFAESTATSWSLTLYGKYNFTFGPTHTPRARAVREKRAKKPRVRHGKVEARQY